MTFTLRSSASVLEDGDEGSVDGVLSETLSPVGLAHLLPKIVNKGFTVEVEGHSFPGQAEPTELICTGDDDSHSWHRDNYGIIQCERCGDLPDEAEAAFDTDPVGSRASQTAPAEQMPAEPMIAPASRDDGPPPGTIEGGTVWAQCVKCGNRHTYTDVEGLCDDCAANEPEKAAVELTGKKRKRSNAERKNRKAKTS